MLTKMVLPILPSLQHVANGEISCSILEFHVVVVEIQGLVRRIGNARVTRFDTNSIFQADFFGLEELPMIIGDPGTVAWFRTQDLNWTVMLEGRLVSVLNEDLELSKQTSQHMAIVTSTAQG